MKILNDLKNLLNLDEEVYPLEYYLRNKFIELV